MSKKIRKLSRAERVKAAIDPRSASILATQRASIADDIQQYRYFIERTELTLTEARIKVSDLEKKQKEVVVALSYL